MAALANLALYTDMALTQIVTFTPVTKKDGVAFWTDYGTIAPDLRPTMSLSVVQVKPNGTVGRVKGKITFPYLGADGKAIETGFMNIEAVIPKGMSEEDRIKLRFLMRSALTTPAVTNAVGRFEDVY